MKWYVYILYSKTFDLFYIGQTNEIGQRPQRHNAGFEKSTAPHVPWEAIWFCEKGSRSEAMKLERKLKNLTKIRLRSFILKYTERR